MPKQLRAVALQHSPFLAETLTTCLRQHCPLAVRNIKRRGGRGLDRCRHHARRRRRRFRGGCWTTLNTNTTNFATGVRASTKHVEQPAAIAAETKTPGRNARLCKQESSCCLPQQSSPAFRSTSAHRCSSQNSSRQAYQSVLRREVGRKTRQHVHNTQLPCLGPCTP